MKKIWKSLLICLSLLLTSCSNIDVSSILPYEDSNTSSISEETTSNNEENSSDNEESSSNILDKVMPYTPGNNLNNPTDELIELSELIHQNTTTGCLYNSDEIVNTICEYETTISNVASDINIPSEYIKAILIHEMSQTNTSDTFADSLVLVYFEQMRNTGSSQSKSDSSTGLGQIFAKTAIYSYNNLINNGIISGNTLDSSNWETVESIWTSLNSDNETNIKYVAYTLKSVAINKNIKSDYYYSNNNAKTVFAAYNGSGEAAEAYAEEVYVYYNFFMK